MRIADALLISVETIAVVGLLTTIAAGTRTAELEMLRPQLATIDLYRAPPPTDDRVPELVVLPALQRFIPVVPTSRASATRTPSSSPASQPRSADRSR